MSAAPPPRKRKKPIGLILLTLGFVMTILCGGGWATYVFVALPGMEPEPAPEPEPEPVPEPCLLYTSPSPRD